MIFFEIIKLAFDSIRANKLRSSLTMLGIAIGVFTVIGVMTVITGIKASIESNLNFLGANSFQLAKYPAINFSDPGRRFRNRRNIDYITARRFKEAMGDSAVVCLTINRGGRRVSYSGRGTNPNVRLVGSDENLATAQNFNIAAGRNINSSDVEYGRAVVILGDDVFKRIFLGEEAVGQRVRIDGQTYLVIGVFAPKGAAFGQSQDNLVVVPMSAWIQAYGQANRSISINVQAPSAELLQVTQERAVGAMRIVRRLDPEDSNDFEMFSNDSLIEAFNNIAKVVSAGAFVISAFALIASGIGVMNIMLVSVTERTKEIGVRKSIGARKKSILTQFLCEAVALSLMGGLIGILVGVAGGNAAGTIFNSELIFPWGWALTGVAVCCVIGVGFGLYPAWKAASLDPIEALRHE